MTRETAFYQSTIAFALLRTASYGLYGGSGIGEVLATAARIHVGDFEGWYVAWHRTASRIETLAARALQEDHRVSAGRAFPRGSNYYRTAEFFLAPYETEWAAISSIASKIGCTAETLRLWVRRVERDAGERPGVTTEEQQRLKLLERENRELRRANEILRKAAAYFAQAELDRRGT
jgi:transposase